MHLVGISLIVVKHNTIKVVIELPVFCRMPLVNEKKATWVATFKHFANHIADFVIIEHWLQQFFLNKIELTRRAGWIQRVAFRIISNCAI